MNMRLRTATIFLFMAAIFVTSVISLSTPREPITREEAIHISKNSKLVKEGMVEYGYAHAIDANYYNSSRARHGIWKVTWSLRESSEVWIGYTVIVVIDAKTGTIIHETKGLGYG